MAKEFFHWIFRHASYPPTISGSDAITGIVAITSLLLVYAYFVLKWATDRVKDLESLKEVDAQGGDPMLTCWIAGVGLLMSTMLNAHISVIGYTIYIKNVTFIQLIPIFCACVTIGVLWRLLTRFLVWYFKNGGEFSRRQHELDFLIGHHHPLKFTVFLFVVSGIIVFVDFIQGNAISAVHLICYQLSSAFGVGGYASLRGDIMPRVVRFEQYLAMNKHKSIAPQDELSKVSETTIEI